MKIGNKVLELPLIQGGMGVGVSLGGLAGAVAKEGGMGVISTAGVGYRIPNYLKDTLNHNMQALAEEIIKAKEIAKGKGLVAINAMVATTDYAQSVMTAVKSGIDCIISGAGLPLELPKLVKDSDVAIAPIVSSAKAISTICKAWDQKNGVAPDFVVVEGSEAGGHLGFKRDELLEGTAKPLLEIVKEVVTAVEPYEEKYNRKIPVFAAGGIYTAEDVTEAMEVGAAGVQVGTRFIATHECDASKEYKEILLSKKKEDVQIVVSPAGLPGRAFRTPLIEKLEADGRIPPKICTKCLRSCKVETAPYCISAALRAAVVGDYENGLFFTGSNGYRPDKIVSVRELVDELMSDWRKKH